MIVLAIKLELARARCCSARRASGRDGNEFRMLKFRTMVRDADERKHELFERNEAAPLFKIADDPRTTRVGRFLRRSSLDELPQLFNVLRGDMSLVGPRPLIVEEDRLFSGWQRRRYLVAPGITGPWQILGSSRVPVSDMVTHRLPVLRQLVALAGRQDPGPHRPLRAQPPQRRAPRRRLELSPAARPDARLTRRVRRVALLGRRPSRGAALVAAGRTA